MSWLRVTDTHIPSCDRRVGGIQTDQLLGRHCQGASLLALCWVCQGGNLSEGCETESSSSARILERAVSDSSPRVLVLLLLNKNCLESCAVTLINGEETDKDKNGIHVPPDIHISKRLKDVPPIPAVLLFSLPSFPFPSLFFFLSLPFINCFMSHR